MLRDLTIQNYRFFKDFHVDDLARVNLIVGKNNSGKTSLLEAIYLLVNQGYPGSLLRILHDRNTFLQSFYHTPDGYRQESYYQVSSIFPDFDMEFAQRVFIKSEKDTFFAFHINLSLIGKVYTYEGPTSHLEMEIGYQDGKDSAPILFANIPVNEKGLLESDFPTPNVLSVRRRIPNQYLNSLNSSFDRLSSLWDAISLTPEEDTVIEAMRILESDLDRIDFLSSPTSMGGIIIRFKSTKKRVPLSVMGDGMRRILGLAIATVTCRNGVLLVDEIETGLYYKTQTDIWKFIIEIAKRLNVQVFATTHSWDCISAFQEALSESSDPSVGKLFRLSARGEDIRAIPYTAEELAVAVPESIEVR